MPRTKLLTVKEAAQHMGVTPGRVYQMIGDGLIKSHRVPVTGRHPFRVYITLREASKHTREATAEAAARKREEKRREQAAARARAAADRAREQEEYAAQWVERQLEAGW